MKINKNIQRIGFLVFVLYTLISCTSMDDYKVFIEGTQVSYPGKIDSVVIYPGDGRVLIKGLFIADPKITKCKIYWNSMEDSVVIDVQRSQGVDTLVQIITLPENLYNFEFFTYDALGNQSIPVYASGRSYGDSYKTSLNNRLITSAIIDDTDLNIVWRDLDETAGAFATNVIYTDNANVKHTVEIGEESETTILDYKIGTDFSISTLYKPDELSIDTFYAVEEKHSPFIKISKANWTATADTYEATARLPLGGPPEFAIDDDLTTYWNTKQTYGGTAFPHWLQVDMSEVETVNAVLLTPLAGESDGDFSDFKVQGKVNDVDDWTDYGTFTLADSDDSQLFTLDSTANIRYLRIYQLNGVTSRSYLAELSVYK